MAQGQDRAVMATELPDELEWINCDIPPSLATSRGKAVLLYFWTYSNIHCMNLLPELRQLENKYENGLVIIGIHCPKFSHETEPATVLKAVNRLFIRHPVALDNGFLLWQKYGVKAWPTAALIDANGHLRELQQGDHIGRGLDKIIANLLEEATAANSRSYTRIRPARKPEAPATLHFPSAVLRGRDYLYVSDTANNRVLELKPNGRIQRCFGSGNPGFWDGSLEQAGFNEPRGLAISDNHLYVADSGNHAVRRINLFNGEIETVVGTGKPGKTIIRDGRDLREMSLTSPWGLVAHGPEIFITMAGLNQIWRLDLTRNTIGWLSGTGQPAVHDGNPTSAAFAFPQGLSTDGVLLFVADSDGSAIRQVRRQNGSVETRVGQGPFVFGCAEGERAEARLQYPMDVALDQEREQLWIADSFNNALRILDLSSGQLSTPQLDYNFAEPAGIDLDDDILWVANTNAHEIVRVDITKRQCQALAIIEPRF